MRFALSTKIVILLAISLLLPLISGFLILLVAIRSNHTVETMVMRGLQHAQEVSALDNSLLEQATLLSLYIHSRRENLLEDLEAQTGSFDQQLTHFRQMALSAEEWEIVDKIGKVYGEIENHRQRSLDLLESGQDEEARVVLLNDVWPAYKETSGLCTQLEKANIGKSLTAARSRYLRNVTILIGIGVIINSVVLIVLLRFLLRRVVFPLRGVFADYGKYLARFHQGQFPNHSKDEMAIIADYFATLKTDVEGSRSDLGMARGRLTETERLTTVGTLAASIAHEIRSPLTSMRLRLFSLNRSFRDDPRIKEDLAVITEETKRLDHIIRNFLEFSRSPKLKLAKCQVLDLIDQCAELLRHDLRNHNVELECQVPPGLPEIHADIQQLKQVIINLVNNAVEAMGKDGRIGLTASEEDNPQGEKMVVLRVRDSGPGIPEAVKEKMFQPFTSTKENGTGLGLSTAKRIMNLHEGDLVLESTGEKGTVFALWIPLGRNGHG